MGITKRPASACSDEIITIEIDENSDTFSDTLSSYDESQQDVHDDITVDFPINLDAYIVIDSVPPYRRLHIEDINYEDNLQAKPVCKKKVSQMGRKKANRAQNEIFLLSLIDEQRPEDEIFYNDNKNGFTKVIKHCTRPDLKESIIEGNEHLVLQKGNKESEIRNDKKFKRNVQPDMAFKNLTPSQKSLFKQKSLPFATIDHLETEVVQYFSRVPNGIYTSIPLPSYHRVLLHGIVRYYSLDATSVNSRGRRSQKIVQVRNSYFDDFKPPQLSLLKFIESKLNKPKRRS